MCCSTICRCLQRIRCRFSSSGTAACRFTAAFLGCTIAIVAFALKRKIPVLSLGDLTTAVAPIGLFLGRLANFINGELWGRPTDVPWAMIFPNRRPDSASSQPAL